MNKFLRILLIVLGIILLIVGIYIGFKIYFIFSIKNGVQYDGFGMPYKFNKPSSPYAIYAFISFISSFYCLSIGFKKEK